MDIVSTLNVTTKHRIDCGHGMNSLGVFCAEDPQLGGEWALKVIAKSGFRDPSEFFSEAQRMFESEHPNVVSIRTASQTADEILLLMPLYARGSLKSLLEREGPLSVCKAVNVGREVLAGVGAIHAGGGVHLDIKPSNVLFADGGAAKVADFGQARELDLTGVATMPDLMYATVTPPETFTHARRGTRLSDIYQVSVTLCQAVNGPAIFNAQLSKMVDHAELQNAIEHGKFPRRDRWLPHVPDRLRRCLRKAMSVDARDRFQSADEFSNALARVLPTLDWKYQLNPDGSEWWEAIRQNRPALCVSKKPNGKEFDIALYTSRNGKVTGAKKGFWKTNLAGKEADQYLSQLFAALLE